MKDKNSIHSKAYSATKWSTFTEVAVKVVSPITNMVLARLISPEEFGVVATVTMTVSFTQMFTEGGFQKYIIQKDFKNSKEKEENANVAFWTNLILSLLFWLVITIYRKEIATLVGSPSLGNVIAISGAQLSITAFSSIQTALYRRELDYKTLFKMRMITSVFVPLFITLPLAFLGLGYWSIIIANISGQLLNAIVLTIKSSWKPTLFFRIKILKEMFSHSIWMLIESLSVWLNNWADTFVIGLVLDTYYLGIYRTSITMINGIMSIITGSTTSVLYSTLSRLKHNSDEFINTFLIFQRLISLLVIPMGVGLFLYRDFVTLIMLGNQWEDASIVIGIWGLVSALTISLGHYNSEMYRALGKTKLSIMAQFISLLLLIPALFIGSQYGFLPTVYTRSIVRLSIIPIHFVIMKIHLDFPLKRIIRNIMPAIIASTVMFTIGVLLQDINDTFLWNIISIIVCIGIYFLVICIFSSVRQDIKSTIKNII